MRTIATQIPLIIFTMFLPATTWAQSVTVQRGDSLSSIAQKELGDASLWPNLCRINSNLLNGDCDQLPVGATLNVGGGQADTDNTARDPSVTQAPQVASLSSGTPLDWVVEGAGVVGNSGTGISVRAPINLLRTAVLDSQSSEWLVGPEDYELDKDGMHEVTFTLPANSVEARVYPLRGRSDQSWVYTVLKDLKGGGTYTVKWRVTQDGELYNLTDFAVTSAS